MAFRDSYTPFRIPQAAVTSDVLNGAKRDAPGRNLVEKVCVRLSSEDAHLFY
jgi:hypothetical protein